MKIGAIIQARMSSSRLPNKVLKNLPYDSDICVLQQVIRRVSNSKLIDEVIVATSDSEEDKKIVDIAKIEEVPYFRGDLHNVLDRFYKAASNFDLDLIVRVTSDNPCIDSNVIDTAIQNHLELGADYTSTALINSFPIGIGCEVINFEVLKESYFNATENFEKEHVTPYIYKTHPEKFKIGWIKGPDIITKHRDIRLTIDTYDDFENAKSIYSELCINNPYPSIDDVVLYLDNHKQFYSMMRTQIDKNIK